MVSNGFGTLALASPPRRWYVGFVGFVEVTSLKAPLLLDPRGGVSSIELATQSFSHFSLLLLFLM